MLAEFERHLGNVSMMPDQALPGNISELEMFKHFESIEIYQYLYSVLVHSMILSIDNILNEAVVRSGRVKRDSKSDELMNIAEEICGLENDSIEDFVFDDDFELPDGGMTIKLNPLYSQKNNEETEKPSTLKHPSKRVATALHLTGIQDWSETPAMKLFVKDTFLQIRAHESTMALSLSDFQSLLKGKTMVFVDNSFINFHEGLNYGEFFRSIQDSFTEEVISAYTSYLRLCEFSESLDEFRRTDLAKANVKKEKDYAKVRYLEKNWEEKLREIIEISRSYCNLSQDMEIPEPSDYLFERKGLYKAMRKHHDSLLMGDLGNHESLRIINTLVDSAFLLEKVPLAMVDENIEKNLNKLLIDFPNFYEVTQYVRESCLFSKMMCKPIKLPNLLLCGNPGIGKTEYLNRLAKMIGIYNTTISLPSLSI